MGDIAGSIGTGLVVAIVVGIAGAAALWVIIRSMWQVAEPNEALIISGGHKNPDPSQGPGFKIVTGAGTLVVPGLQTARRLSLKLREAQLSTDCVTRQGIPVKVLGVCIYKIGDDSASIANAARRFLDQEATIDGNIQNLFDGHLRSIIGELSVEELISDREKLTGATRTAASDEMQRLGLIIDSLQIKDIKDPTGYIENLAKPHIAAVVQAANIAQAAADQASAQAQQEAAANIAAATRDSAIKQAGYSAEVASAKAQAAQQGPLADAIAQQKVVVEQTKMAQLQAEQKEQELQVTVRKPADAEAYATKVTAEARRDADISAAQAAAQKIQLDATAQANATQVRGEAQASATRATGAAEADASKAKLLAEAEGIKARAEALATNQDAVISQMIAEKFPEIVAQAAKPFGNIKEMVMLDGGASMGNMMKQIIGTGMSLVPMIKQGLAPRGSEQSDPTPTNGNGSMARVAVTDESARR